MGNGQSYQVIHSERLLTDLPNQPLRQLVPSTNVGRGNAKVDIVAVHGLNILGVPDDQYAWDTWRVPAGKEGRLWLKDDLPEYTPEASIFLYEYEASLAFGCEEGQYHNKANDLLEDLRLSRKLAPSRPLIFLAHSLGGLLVKQVCLQFIQFGGQ